MRFGHRVLDDDHEQLLALAEELEALVAVQSTPSCIRAKFLELGRYSIEHFQREERLMEDAQCPDLVRHKHEHEEIARWFPHLDLALAESHAEVLEAATSQTIAFLQAWIERHLTELDGPAIRYMLSNTTTPPLPSASKVGSPG